MSAHLKALIGVLLACAVIAGIFFAFFYEKEPAEQGPSIDLVEKMRTQSIPEMEAQDLNGKDFDFTPLKGKILIINFWASWCAPCIEEVPSLVALIAQLNGQVELVAISGDSEIGEITSFLKSFPSLQGPNITLLWDQNKVMVKRFGVERLPETFIVGRDLKLVKKVVGSVSWDHPESVTYFKELISKP